MEDTALVNFYRSLPPPDANTVRFIQRFENDFVCLENDALKAAQHVYKTVSAVRKFAKHEIEYCAMNSTLMKNFLVSLLQNLGQKIEIYHQEQGHRSKWSSKPKRASPGNLQEIEDLIGSQTTQKPVNVAVWLKKNEVSVCFIDCEQRTYGLSTFTDNDLFSSLESFVIQLNAKEVLIPNIDNLEFKRITKMMEQLNILVTKVNTSLFSTSNEVLNAAVKHLNADLDLYTKVEHNLFNFMRLDSSALRALNVMPDFNSSGKNMSLFDLLNKCQTTSGSRLLQTWLKQPLTTLTEINERLDIVEILKTNQILNLELTNSMKSVPDLNKITRKFVNANAKLEDVVRVYHLAITLPDFINSLEDQSEVLKTVYATPIKNAFNELAKLIELVETTIDLNALERHEFIVKADFDDHLLEIKNEREETLSKMNAELERVNKQLKTDKVKLENNPTLGFAFRLTRTDAGCLRGAKDIIDLKTQKAGQFFTTPNLRMLATTHQELSEQYRRQQHELSSEIITTASSYLPVFQPLGNTLAHLDVLLSFATVSSFSKLPYTRPQFGDSFNLKDARHPCMEVQPDMMFIPNDVNLNHKDSEFTIITGPNMGGKSTYIRQTGVISLMAQIGCFVPCSKANVCLVDSILARVGAGDSQLKGISTFMAEMLETASILKSATSNSLIIIDELGRGTSTYDGFGLAYAISKHIVDNIKCFTLFATHFHELTQLSEQNTRVNNLHVVANEDSNDIKLLYKVEPGVAQQSFGVHVAEVVNFPKKVVEMAKRRVSELEDLEVNDDSKLRKVLKEWGGRDGVEGLRKAINEST